MEPQSSEELTEALNTALTGFSKLKNVSWVKWIFVAVGVVIAVYTVYRQIAKREATVRLKKQRVRELQAETVRATQAIRATRNMERKREMAERIYEIRTDISQIDKELDREMGEISSAREKINSARTWSELSSDTR